MVVNIAVNRFISAPGVFASTADERLQVRRVPRAVNSDLSERLVDAAQIVGTELNVCGADVLLEAMQDTRPFRATGHGR
jgi:hypothetical protein